MSVFTDLYDWATDSGRRSAPTTTQKAQGFGDSPPTWGMFNDVIGTMTDALVAIRDAWDDSEFTVQIPPSAGGWQVLTGGATFGGSALEVSPNAAGTPVVMACNISQIVLENGGDSAAEWTLTGITVSGERSASGSLAIIPQMVSGGAWGSAGTGISFGAADTEKSQSYSLALNPDVPYRLWISAAVSGGETPADTFVTDVTLTFTRNGVP